MLGINMRLWDKERKQYLNDFLSEMAILPLYDEHTTYEEIVYYLKTGDLTRFVGELFTTMKDANDIDIYEGDIVKRSDGKVYLVVWDEYMFNLKGFFDPGFDYPAAAFSEGIALKVIGNIHEHPHLLEEERS